MTTERIGVLIGLLHDDDIEQRRRAAESLAHLGPDALPAVLHLVQACGDADEQVREWSAAALESLPTPNTEVAEPLVALLSAPLDIAYWAATLLGRIGSPAGNAKHALTTTATQHPDPAVRRRAAWALEKIGE